jgi:tetratricopeptide (TPR) repeat protein
MTTRRKKPKTRWDSVTFDRLSRIMTREGSYKGAEDNHALALETQPNDAYTLVGLGDLKRKKKQFTEAAHYYQRCLEIEKDNKFALAGLGDAYRGLKQVEKALEVWLHYLSLHPHDYKVMTRVADGFKRKGDLEAAKEYFFRALEENLDDPYALMGLGDIHQREGNDEEALRYFEKLIHKSDDPVLALTSAGNIYRKRPMKYYERVLALDSENSYAWHGKADCYRGMRDYSPAIDAWHMALTGGMEPRIALTRIGDAYLSLNDLKQAEINYKKALEFGYDKYAHLGMARIHAKRDDTETALHTFSMLAKEDPYDLRIAAELRNLTKKHPKLRNALKKIS